MKSVQVVIEDWDGDGAIRIPDEVLQEMGVDVGDSLYLLEEYVGTTRCLVLSRSPQLPNRIAEFVNTWDSSTPKHPENNLVSRFPASYPMRAAQELPLPGVVPVMKLGSRRPLRPPLSFLPRRRRNEFFEGGAEDWPHSPKW